MKQKTYIKPETKTYEVQANGIFATSPGGPSGNVDPFEEE